MRKSLSLALSLLGLFDSTYLWWAYTAPNRPLVCVGGGCDVVRASEYAYFRGIPLPAYGAALYAVLAVLIFIEALASDRLRTRLGRTSAALAGGGFLVSLYLTAIEAFVLRAWCAWCVVSAASIALIFILALLESLQPTSRFEPLALRRYIWILVAGVCVGTPAFFLLARSGKVLHAPVASAEALGERLVRPNSHSTGNAQAPLTVVEFADFECPFCKRAEQAAREVRARFGNDVRFVFRHFPMERLHAHAEKAAEASECAAEQGKFWEAEERFYAGQSDLTETALVRYAGELGLDLERFRRCLSSGEMAARVRRDVEDGRALGVRAPPTFVIGRQIVEGSLDLAQFSELVEKQLADHNAMVAASRASVPPPQSPSQPETPKAPAHKKPGRDPEKPANSLLGSSPGGIFTQFQSSGMTCSEEEASKRQPNLVRTPDARKLFERDPKPLFVDVREAKDFATQHIPGAINVPADKMEQRWDELPRDRDMVLYESGTAPGDVCATSRAAGRVLLAHGFSPQRVMVYQDGLAGWQKAELPLGH